MNLRLLWSFTLWFPSTKSSLQFPSDSEAISILIWSSDNLSTVEEYKKQLKLMMFKLKAVDASNADGNSFGDKK